jgi:hypothetical protein
VNPILLIIGCTLLLCVLCPEVLKASDRDTLPSKKLIDSFIQKKDSGFSLLANKLKSSAKEESHSFNNDQLRIRRKLDSTLRIGFRSPSVNNISSKQLIRFTGGTINEDVSFRATIDTPYFEKGILQQVLSGQFQFVVADRIPLRFLYLIRNSNSNYFRDIYNLRLEFDRSAFQNQLGQKWKRQIENELHGLKDSAQASLYFASLKAWKYKLQWIEDPLNVQRLVEMNEVYRIPKLTYDPNLPDSVARKNSDSARTLAKEFIDEYLKRKNDLEALTQTKDSLKRIYDESERQYNELKNRIENGHEVDKVSRSLYAHSGQKIEIPKQYRWLMNIREAAVGRSQINQSELTAKNLPLNGINFEYNSWYYFSVTAGLIDYRFRDFVHHDLNKQKQYMYLVRMGIGRKERNYFILSYFGGKKQLYALPGGKLLPVFGFSAEAKLQLTRSSFVTTEAAQSFSNDYHLSPPTESKTWNLSDKTNKAISVRYQAYLPKTSSSIEALYKYAGANYQSFSYFQPSNALQAWYFKGNQQLFKRQLKISFSVQSNDFSNPYLHQEYSSNTIYKSIYLTYKRRHWPSVSIGYTPSSQISKVDSILVENRFQSLNGSFNHFYSIGTLRTATTIVYNRFFNKSADSSFIFFNAINFFISQNLFFSDFTVNSSVSVTRNGAYDYRVLEDNIQFRIGERGSLSLGIKVNNFNKSITKVSGSGSVQFPLGRKCTLNLSADQGYLPGTGKELIRNDFYRMGFSTYFQ